MSVRENSRRWRLIAFFSALLAPICIHSQNQAEPSHQERFAPPAKAMEKAESDLTARLAASPKDASLLSARGLLRLQLNRVPDGMADLQQATAVAPGDAQFHLNLAYGLLLNTNPNESIAETRKALSLDERSFAAHALLGRILISHGGDPKEAIEHLQRSLEINPTQRDLRFDLLAGLRKEKDFVAAGVQLRILKDQLPPGDARLEYAQGMLSADLGYPEAAAASFRRAVASNPNFLVARQDLGGTLVKMGKWKEAAEILGPLAQVQPNSYIVAYMNALALQNSQRKKAAEGEVRRALTLDAKSADAHILLGIILSSQGQYQEAITELSNAATLDANSFDAHFYLGRSRYALSDTAGATEALQKAVALRPDNPEARFFLGTVLEVAGDQEGAMTQYKELQRISPEDARGYVGLGGVLGKTGKTEEALVQLRRARELDPSNFETSLSLGRLLAKAGNIAESIGFLQEAARESPQSPEIHYQLALSLQRVGRKAEAAKEFAEVDRLNRERRGAGDMGAAQPKP